MYEDIADMSHPPVHAVDMVRAVKR